MPDQKISLMSPASALTGAELIPVVQSAANRRTTAQAIASLAPATNLTYDAATRLLSSSTGTDVTIPLVNTTAAGLIPHTWLTGAEAATFPHIHGALAGVVYEHVRNVSGSAMAALTPYHVVGSQGDTDRVQIIPANASDPASMPASGILMTALADNEDGHGVIAGVPTGLDTVANPSGTVLYVGTGVLTPTAPAANVQAIAIVGRSHASTGTLSMIGGPSLARVAYTGAYGDLLNPPSIPAPANQTPAALGTAATGTGTNYALQNHVHQMPSAGDVGADPAGTAAGAISAHVAASDPHTQYLRPTEVVAGTNVTVDTSTTPGSVIINSTATGGSPGGSGTEIQYRSGATTFGAIAGSSVDPATGNTTFSAQWISTRNSAASAPAHALTGTWFTGGTTTTTKPHFLIEPAGTASTGWDVNGTGLGLNAPSGFTGDLAWFGVNGASRMSITSAGHVRLSANCRFLVSGAPFIPVVWGSTSFVLARNYGLSWSTNDNDATSPPATTLIPDSSNILAQRNATNAQTFRVYNTFTSATSHERGKLEWASNVLLIGTEKGTGGGTARAMELQTDGVTRIRIGAAGQLGFFGAAAVAQPAAIPDATDAASTQTGLNSVLAALRSLGLIAT